MTVLRQLFAAFQKVWMPTEITPLVRRLAWASVISQVAIVATGGAVRLTESGLGCDTWPKCVNDSWTATSATALHGAIEFGNRLLTFVLVLIAGLMVLSVLRMRRERPDLLRLALVLVFGIVAQAVIGGISVLVKLNPFIVGLHFAVSALLIIAATALLERVQRGQSFSSIPSFGLRILSALVVFSACGTIILGVLTSGAGPYAGHIGDTPDANIVRNGLDAVLLQHLHSYPAYILLAALLLELLALRGAKHPAATRATLWALGAVCVQAMVGIAQSRLGLPKPLVEIHLILAATAVALLTWQQITLRRLPERSQQAGAAASQRA